MHKDNHHSPVAVAYAEALLELAEQSGAVDSLAQELRDLRQILDTTPKFAEILANPAIGEETRATLLKNVFGGRASQLLLNFLMLANTKGRLGIVSAVAGAYAELLDERNRLIEADITVARKLDDSQL